MKIVFLGDAHLVGMEDRNQQALARFIDSLSDINKLVILGDLFDFWTELGHTNSTYAVYGHYQNVLTALLRLSHRGAQIIYIEGNHDFSMGRWFVDVLKASVHPDYLDAEIDGKRFFMSHGDIATGDAGYLLWRWFLRSPFFKALKACLAPGLVLRVASMLSRKSRGNGKDYEALERNLRQFARQKLGSGLDVVVLGHSHSACIHTEATGSGLGTYANPGGWADGFNYLVYENGGFRLERFVDGGPST
jgi:UDP-2,3-diacylglucosamine hydrolase